MLGLKLRSAGALVLLVALFWPAPSAAAPRPAERQGGLPRIGLVLDGSRDDESFNQLAYEGALIARTRYDINFSYVEAATGSTPVYVRDLERFARQGYDLVIGVGFTMAPAMLQAARAFPRTHFALVDSEPVDARGRTVNVSNVANLLFREQESGYLVGYMAGLMEKEKIGSATHNTIGALGGISIPPVNRYIAGYSQGARAADPRIKILLAYNGSFSDQARAYQIGLRQIRRRADILFQVAGAAGLGYLNAAQAKSHYGIGVDADQSYLGSYIMTSAIKRVDQAIVLTVGNLVGGRFRAGDNIFDLRDGGTGYGTVSPMVPQSVINQVNARASLIAAGKIVPTTVISLTTSGGP
jgi:basic membrane protein A